MAKSTHSPTNTFGPPRSTHSTNPAKGEQGTNARSSAKSTNPPKGVMGGKSNGPGKVNAT